MFPGAFRPTFEDVQHCGFVEPFFLRHLLAGAAQTTLVNMLLEAVDLAAASIHARQHFGERPPAVLALKAPTGKVQEDPLPEQIEITHTALRGAVPQRTGYLATGAQRDGMTMTAEQVRHFLPIDLFRHISDQFKFGQATGSVSQC